MFQLQFLEEIIQTRQRNYLTFESTIRHNNDLICLDHSHIRTLSSFALPILCKSKAVKEKYIDQFSGAGIEIRPMIAGNIQKQPFFNKYVSKKYNLSDADFIHECGFYCGNYPELTEIDIETISSCLSNY
jgi:CDP-6-deoxy-D-xylo-4-hexulose-3-dehydrase